MNNKNQYLLTPFLLAFSISALLLPQASIAGKISAIDWDNDGLSDKTEARIGSSIYLADTDGDGISDKDEIGNIRKPRDTDKDGRIDILDDDDDGDGIPTVLEGTLDTDKDGKANYLDTDSDGDGLADGFEVRLTGRDSNEDGIDDLFDAEATKGQDVNGDGIDDNIVFVDSNKNGVADILDKKSSLPHLKLRLKNDAAKSASSKKEIVRMAENKPPVKTVVVAAAKLPERKVSQNKNIKHTGHSYTEKKSNSASKNADYGGSGYFYCGSTGKIVKGIKGFMMTPPGKVSLLRDATEGDYKWRVEEPGTYAIQFQIPGGMSIVRGLAKGRRIIKEGDSHPLILGTAENPAKKGYLVNAKSKDNVWYTSFEIKDNAPLVKNNNIPLAGGVCNK